MSAPWWRRGPKRVHVDGVPVNPPPVPAVKPGPGVDVFTTEPPRAYAPETIIRPTFLEEGGWRAYGDPWSIEMILARLPDDDPHLGPPQGYQTPERVLACELRRLRLILDQLVPEPPPYTTLGDHRPPAWVCREQGWKIGTCLHGDEGHGVTVIRITAIGENAILARPLLHDDQPVDEDEGMWVLDGRDWKRVEC